MKAKKSFKDLVNQMDVLQKDEQGKLTGGFTSLATDYIDQYKQDGNSVSVSVSGDTCSCHCSCSDTLQQF
ncbi:hypothetical protein [Williamwhitmania taraxaci]|uniref:Uncharacterized protein n=1 Tax=Williamwhitmania taraxaci TaxID=1640674 RepID=A0A1G6S112_9BACT|nr:hypothetical protein [Williamwhitmania taraxaci]SDD09857.1 hypothetical protein SAMN05216323_10844 [Williamwhitmania taraxaci]